MTVRRHRRSGQAAVEAVFAMPVMLLLFIIGFKLWAMTWNAQYVHVKARYSLMIDANHMPCDIGDGSGGVQKLNKLEERKSAMVRGDTFRGPEKIFRATARDTNMKAKATLKCEM